MDQLLLLEILAQYEKAFRLLALCGKRVLVAVFTRSNDVIEAFPWAAHKPSKLVIFTSRFSTILSYSASALSLK